RSAGSFGAVVCVGLLVWSCARVGSETADPPRRGTGWSRAFAAMHEARLKDGRPLGTLFGDAVKETMSALLFVGGTIIMFSVLIRMLAVAGVTGRLTAAVAPLAAARGVDVSLIEAVVKGLVDTTTGAQAAAAATAPLTQRAVAAAGIIAWSGLSVHAQVAAMVRGTNIRVVPYIAARALHGALAAAFAWVLMGPALGV